MSPSGVELDRSTYSAGGPPMTISGSVYTLVPHPDNNDSVAGDDPSNQAGDSPLATNPLTIAGHTVVPNPSGIVIDGSSLVPGGSALTLSNITSSLGSSGILVIGSSTTTLTPQFVFTIGSQTFIANPTGFTLDDATIAPGGSAQTIDGIPISLGLSGILVLGSSTFAIPTPTPIFRSNKPIVIAGQTITSNPSAFSIAGTTISAGGLVATIDGIDISLGLSGALVVGSSTFNIPTPAAASPANNPFVIAGQTITPDPSAFSIAGTIISAGGPPVTVDGTVLSLQPSGSLIVGSSTLALSASQPPVPSIDGIDGSACKKNLRL